MGRERESGRGGVEGVIYIGRVVAIHTAAQLALQAEVKQLLSSACSILTRRTRNNA